MKQVAGSGHPAPLAGTEPAPLAAPAGGEGVEWVAATLPRQALRAVQTPQAFAFDLLWASYRAARQRGERGFTDEAMVVERAGAPVAVVPGDPRNLKLTYPADFTLAEAWLAVDEPRGGGGAGPGAAPPVPWRVGIGYDVHPVDPDRPLVLGGVRIPAGFGLRGHSDADVVLHALMDALLGAAGLPDIGHLFPPTDARWAGADSAELLRQVVARLLAEGWRPAQVDVTVVAERPPLAPHVPAMRERIAAALAVSPAAVGIKATTNEGLGFAGRGEGLAALAVAVIVPAR